MKLRDEIAYLRSITDASKVSSEMERLLDFHDKAVAALRTCSYEYGHAREVLAELDKEIK